jgi:methanesulfonate monooxygenase small subunit
VSERASRASIEELIYRSALCLDERDFEGFLALCAPTFRYTIEAHSPELRRDMIWLDHDKAGIEALFRTLPKHNSDHALLSRHVTVYTTSAADADGASSVVSALQVFRTDLDGGATALFAVGKLHDDVRFENGRAWLVRRRVRLDTRMLGIGSHIPF